MPAPHRRALLAGALAVALTASAAACGGSEEKPAGDLEKSEITVGTIPVAPTAPLQLAISRGLFKAEGLTVKSVNLNGGAEAMPRMKSGQLDFSFGNYVSFFAASQKGTFHPKIVAEAYQGAFRSEILLVPKNSPIISLRDLKGKKIGVNTKRNISSLLVRAAARPEGVELDEDKNFVEVPPPKMEAALKSGSIDAVMAIEPFGTEMQEELGARMVADMSSGPTTDFPIAGWATTEEFAAKNPKTVAAFQRAIVKAQGLAADHKQVQDILPKYVPGVDANVASTMTLGTYPTSLNARRLQRVADMMQQFGLLSAHLDVEPLLASGASSG